MRVIYCKGGDAIDIRVTHRVFRDELKSVIAKIIRDCDSIQEAHPSNRDMMTAVRDELRVNGDAAFYGYDHATKEEWESYEATAEEYLQSIWPK